MPAKSRPLALYYVLVAYVCLQFLWWAYLLYDLNTQIHDLRFELLTLQSDATDTQTLQRLLDAKLSTQVWMILGEGTVFLFLLLLGHHRVRRAFQKETRLLQQQRNFLLSVTHELKTPLAAVKLYIETLLNRDLEKEKQQSVLKSALAQSDRLNQLVENILLATSIENQTYTTAPTVGNLSAFIQQLLDNSAALSRESHKLNTRLEPNVHARFDELSMTSILENLLENAVKYTPRGSAITVSLAIEQGRPTLKVADEGPGVDAAIRDQIFQKFFRGGDEETRTTKGTGLGLYITKALADELDASIEVASNSPHGAIFAIRFRPA